MRVELGGHSRLLAARLDATVERSSFRIVQLATTLQTGELTIRGKQVATATRARLKNDHVEPPSGPEKLTIG